MGQTRTRSGLRAGLLAGLWLAPVTGSALCPPVTSWTVGYNGSLSGADRPRAAATTNGGDLVVAGTTDGGAWVASWISAAGGVLWTVTGGGAPGLGSIVRGVAVDPSDNVILAIEDDRGDIGQGKNWLLVMLDWAGAVQWSVGADLGAGLDDAPLAVAVDQFSSIIVAGYADTAAQGEQWRIRKYDSSGGLFAGWDKVFDGPVAGGDDRAGGVDTDNAGRIFVGGWETTAAQGTNWRIRVYDPAGSYLGWVFPSYNNPDNTNDLVNALTVDGFGRIVLAGAEDRTGLGQGWNWRVITYSSAGTQIVSATYDSPYSLDDVANAVAVDGCGNVIAAGSEDHPVEGLNSAVRKWGPDGLVLWTVTANGPGTDDDGAYAVVVPATGEAVVAGMETRTDLGEDENWVVRSFGDGCVSLQSSMEITPASPGLCEPFTVKITVTNSGNCLLSSLDAVASPPRIEGPAVFVGGPSAASANPGGAASYTYSYMTTGVDLVTISATPTGLRQDTGAPVTAAAVCSATIMVVGPAGPPDPSLIPFPPAPAPVASGGPMMWRFLLLNSATDTALAVRVTDTLPPGLGYAGCYGSSCWMDNSIVTWNIGTLPMNASVLLSVSVYAPGQGLCNASWSPCDFGECPHVGFTNVCATAYWDAAIGLVPQPVVPNAMLVPSVTASATVVAQDGVVTYRIKVENTCNGAATGVSVWDSVPAGASYVGCGGAPCVRTGPLVVWTLPGIAAGGTYAVTFTVSLTGAGPVPMPDAMAGFANAVLQPQPALSGTSPTVATINPAPVVTKTGPPVAQTGEQVTWVLQVSNLGGQDTAWNVVLRDVLPEPFVFLSGTGGATASGQVVTWPPIIALPPGATAPSVSVTARSPVVEESFDRENRAYATCVNSATRFVQSADARVRIILDPKLVVRVYPVPFSPAVAARGTLKFSGLPDGATVRIFTTGGLLVKELTVPVRHRLEWDGRNTDGSPVAPGAYLYLITIPGGENLKGNFGVIR